MSDGEPFSLELVKQFLLVRGGKVTNHELVKHFKAYLNDPVNKADVRIKFKDYVNTLASVREEEGTKFLILKKEYYTDLHGQRCELLPTPNASDDLYYDSNLSQPFSDPPVDYDVPPEARASCKADWMSPSPEQMAVADECPQSVAYMPQFTNRSVHETSVDCENVPPPLPKKKHSIESSVKWPDGPHPPPRGRKNHGRRGSQVEQRVRQFSAEKELGGSTDAGFKDRAPQDVTVSPGTVKEKTLIINRMSEGNLLNAKSPAAVAARRREVSSTRSAADDDTTSVSTLDPRRREWLLKAAQADYHALVRLLREDPQLYRFEDFTSGYTALHWAAKHGSTEIVKLVAGTYGLNPNVKSHGGYTPLHLAAIFQRHDVIELLTTTYGADPDIRDHSGRKPSQYLSGVGSLFKNDREKTRQPSPTRPFEREMCFMRIGSFNSRVKRTAAALTGSFGSQKLKAWSSADSVIDSAPCSSMHPPGNFPKKKKSKKVEPVSSSSMDSLKSKLSLTSAVDSDSDSTCGFPS